RHIGAGVHRMFLIGGPAITVLFLALQTSIPLSLGLLGALSELRDERFRIREQVASRINGALCYDSCERDGSPMLGIAKYDFFLKSRAFSGRGSFRIGCGISTGRTAK
ncbi:MAG: hypothetical protein HGA50_04415, partial [Deltaproteobacteria bacterium]|nr:hypothetical protein [Deltaproteobacteria bacterium]